MNNLSKVLAFSALALFSSMAQAICVINLPYDPGPGGLGYGAETAVTNTCGSPIDGGAGMTSSSTVATPLPYYSGSGSATANLNTGILTSYSAATSGGSAYSGALLWDTFSFSGLPASGAMLTATLTLTGSMSGSGSWNASIGLNGGITNTYASGDSSTPIPGSISLSFLAQNGTPVELSANLQTQAGGYPTYAAGVANLMDPPTFSILTPYGTTYTSASGQFLNVQAVPEPETYGMMLAGLGLMGFMMHRKKSA